MFVIKLYVLVLSALILDNRVHTMKTQEFFPDAAQNLTKINWAHAVNNQSYLSSTLKDAKIDMIEADIVLGTITGQSDTTPIPIMAHPPTNTSDLSLESFLTQVRDFNTSESSKKGVKLDFKTIDVFEASKDYVAKFNEVDFPIWINADILAGPINSTVTPVDPARFFATAKLFVNATLSVGWTTNYGANMTGSYSSDEIEEMIETVKKNNVSAEITFPVRAGLAAESVDLLVNLTSEFEGSTLTIWSSEGDHVDVDKLRKLIKTVGLNKTYVDVPSDLKEKLHLDNLGGGAGQFKSVSLVGLLVSVLVMVINLV
ncbi:protein FAM151B [Anthonomus grandis grandis]|uniref:protein FAM151B n=1 Tax=Anthonomus grandis grandis TaxID=2921223 RepID=UPI0021656CDF|nr:protein FAM151B [Anthonomus grandis grandis]XP_050308172.1 protein FAM151B [Anthonomus grandis grandis]XP_050308173.1 protein FAM151B [Anthonomus grandis grandis]